MFLSFLVLAMLPVMVTPIMTHELFQNVYDFERSIIGMDNGAIVLGRADRRVFNFLENTNALLSGLEKVHHPIHALVLGGLASPSTVAEDKALELSIEKIFTSSMMMAQTMWSKSGFDSLKEAHKLAQSIGISQRSALLPVRKRRCYFCAELNFIEVKTNEAKSAIISSGMPTIKPLVVELFQKENQVKKQWEYRFINFFKNEITKKTK